MIKEQEKVAAIEGVIQPEEKKNAKDELFEQLSQGVQNVMNSDNYKNWLDTSSRLCLNNFSFNNAILIFSQKPDATYAMGYEAWKDFGRNVAKGAKSAKIFVPIFAYEKTEGALHRMIMKDLQEQIKQNPEQIAVYKVSNCEFTMNKNKQVGLQINGKERGIFPNQQEMKQFITSAILGKVPMYYNVGTIFDIKDTIIPEYLWVKKNYTKDEVVKDKNGKPIKNNRGEVKIINTPERQAKFQTKLNSSVVEYKDPAKMEILYNALKAVSERNGISVTDVSRESDQTLKEGADGYFSREFSEQKPKGFIIMPDDLEPTRKCAVLIHEMAHSDLHGNLEKLAAEMGEEKIPQHMREIQAESVAYATAKQFGIETDTESFQYLAAYSKGFELQDLKKSLDVVYRECKKLTQEIKAELDTRGLHLDLSDKQLIPMTKEAVQTLSKQYTSYALEQTESNNEKKAEMPKLAIDNHNNPDLLSIIKEQKSCIDRQESAVQAILNGVETLQNAVSREDQKNAIDKIEAAKRTINDEKSRFSELDISFADIAARSKATLKEEFARVPLATLEAMKKDYPKLESLSDMQLAYVAKSKFIKYECDKFLKTDPEKFVEKVCQRAETIDKVIAKNGTFVEINACEQWTDKPIVNKGALIHPKVADSIIKQAEMQIRVLKAEAEKNNDYFPYNKCSLTVFTKSGNNLIAFQTRVDIGDGEQVSLSDHLAQLCGKESDLVTSFDKATREKGAKEKIELNEVSESIEDQQKEGNTYGLPENLTHGEWLNAIEQEKAEKGQNQQEATEQEKTENKSNIEH